MFFPLTFASNTFVDPTTTPTWLARFIDANPVSHLVSAVRGLMHDTGTNGHVAYILIASAALIAVFAPITFRLYDKLKPR